MLAASLRASSCQGAPQPLPGASRRESYPTSLGKQPAVPPSQPSLSNGKMGIKSPQLHCRGAKPTLDALGCRGGRGAVGWQMEESSARAVSAKTCCPQRQDRTNGDYPKRRTGEGIDATTPGGAECVGPRK